MAENRKQPGVSRFSFGFVFPGLRKAVKGISTGGHPELGTVLVDLKSIAHNHDKLIFSQLQAASNLMKWSKEEDNSEIRSLFYKFAEMEQLSAQIYEQYISQITSYRKTFKHILKVEQTLDEMNKATESSRIKAEKLTRICINAKKPSEQQIQDMNKALSISEDATAAVAAKMEQVAIFKHAKVRSALQQMLDAEQALHEKNIEIICAKRRLLETLLPKEIPRQKSIDSKELVDCGLILSEVATQLELSRPIIVDTMTPSPDQENPGFLRAFLRHRPKEKKRKKKRKPEEVFSKATFFDTMTNRPQMSIPTPAGNEGDSDDSHDYMEPYGHIAPPKPLPRPANSFLSTGLNPPIQVTRRPAKSMGDLTDPQNYPPRKPLRLTLSVCEPDNDYLDIVPNESQDEDSSSDDEEYMHLFDIVPPKNENMYQVSTPKKS